MLFFLICGIALSLALFVPELEEFFDDLFNR